MVAAEEAAVDGSDEEDEEAKPTKGRGKKKAFVLDFTAELDVATLLKKSRKAKTQQVPTRLLHIEGSKLWRQGLLGGGV